VIAIGAKVGTGEWEVLGLDVGPGSGYTLGSQSASDAGDDWSLVIRINDTGSTSGRSWCESSTDCGHAASRVCLEGGRCVHVDSLHGIIFGPPPVRDGGGEVEGIAGFEPEVSLPL
jgi:hypothetical protein